MQMELQGKKATHDFLSLCNKDSSFQLQDSRPLPSQGFFPKTHDFLRPLERAEKGSAEAATGSSRSSPAEGHLLPGGIGTYSITHVPGFGSLAPVKHEGSTCSVVGPTAEQNPQTTGAYGAYGAVGGFTLWDDSTARENTTGSRGQWPPPPSSAARGSASIGSLSSSRKHNPSPAQDKKRLMDGSNRGRGFQDDEEEFEDEFRQRDGLSAEKVKVDGKSSDQKPSTPRSKHSATEQRRRCKINDRFQILTDLIPHSDQKRDKASFLLEVIEYIRFLQEKVHKYESLYPAWNQEPAKLTPWRNSQGPGAGIRDPSQGMKNGTATPGFMFSGNENSSPVVQAMLSNVQNPTTDFDMCAGGSYKSVENAPGFLSKEPAMPASFQANMYASERETSFTQPQPTLLTESDNLVSDSQPQWLRPCSADCTLSSETNEHEELTIDEGTISVSSVYSQGLLTSLSQALRSSGVDLSQATISVQINLGKRACTKPTATTLISSDKDHGDPSSGNGAMGHLRMGSSAEESEQAPKRHKPHAS